MTPGTDDNFVGLNVGAHALRGATELAIRIPLTNRNLHLGIEGDVGSIGWRFYWRDGRLRKGASLGAGGGFSIGVTRRVDCDD